MATIHISQTEAEHNLHALLSRLDEHTSFIIENESRAVAILQALPSRRSTLTERLAALPDDSEAIMDDDFARDVQAAIDSHREPLDRSLWDE